MKRKHVKKINSMFFEQYKLIVNSAEKVSFKRQAANKFYLTVNSGLLAIASYAASLNLALSPTLISILGLIISLNWVNVISAYSNLNSAKFKVINDMEKQLPYPVFKLEYDYLKLQKYYALTNAEKWVPCAFLVIYLAILTIALPAYLQPWSLLKNILIR